MDPDGSSAKRGSIFGMAMTGVRNLLTVSHSLRESFLYYNGIFFFKVDEISRVKTLRASTSIDEVDTSIACVTFLPVIRDIFLLARVLPF